MLKKYIIVADTEKEPFVDCSLSQFLQNCDIVDFYEIEMNKDELRTYEN